MQRPFLPDQQTEQCKIFYAAFRQLARMKLTREQQEVLVLLERTNKSVFLTGKAGTGKSTLINSFLAKTRKHVAVLAPTGIAALNVGGCTVHRFCKIGIDRVKKSDVKRRFDFPTGVETIIIDEVSMMRADLMDVLDWTLRKNMNQSQPFGGVQMVFVGDMSQLPPVLTKSEETWFNERYNSPYFFSAQVFHDIDVEYCELQEVHRQTDKAFVKALNEIREGTVSTESLSILNTRIITPANIPPANALYLATRNKEVISYNKACLSALNSPIKNFAATISGDVKQNEFPVPETLELAIGARVMMKVNAVKFANGTCGTLQAFYKDEETGLDFLRIKLDNEETVDVFRHTWEKVAYSNASGDDFEKHVTGSFTQFPVKLAWAITIHGSQGQTFDTAVVDLGSSVFAHGQTYVALSRLRTLQGLFLMRPVIAQDLIFDKRIEQAKTLNRVSTKSVSTQNLNEENDELPF